MVVGARPSYLSIPEESYELTATSSQSYVRILRFRPVNSQTYMNIFFGLLKRQLSLFLLTTCVLYVESKESYSLGLPHGFCFLFWGQFDIDLKFDEFWDDPTY